MRRIFTLLALSAAGAFAQTTPVITQILNNYSLINPGIVAQGAIFIVKGSNLSDATTGLQSVPLQTTLQGVSIRITIGSVTTQAPLYYVLPQQLAGILPSTTPVGTGTLVVNNNGRTASAPITVIKSGFGGLTLNGAGTGGAAVHDSNYNLLSNTNVTNPGKVVIIYGTGLGPTTGNETVSQEGANASGDLSGIPITVMIGGKPAQVLYHGRTIYPGLDQINVLIPTLDDGNYSCNVIVTISTGTTNVQGNVLTIPIAATGNTCSSPTTGGNTSVTPTNEEISRWSAANAYTTGTVGLLHTTGYVVRENIAGVTVTNVTKSDGFSANFNRLSGADVARSLSTAANAQLVPVAGQCSVLTNLNPFPNIAIAYLDAGPAINSNGPNGIQSAVKTVLPTQTVYVANNIPAIVAGRYNFSGTGGPDVGAFSGNLDLAPELVWTNTDDAKVVTRANDLSIQWTGGDPNQLVTITGQSSTSTGIIGVFFCWANNSDGHFTIPPSILNRLPASSVVTAGTTTVITRGNLNVYSMSQTRLTAPGMDLLIGSGEWSTTVTAQYK